MELKWGEINRWAKNLGYKITKSETGFCWIKLSDQNKNNQSNSLSLVVKQIYNDYTDNKWLDHQNSYQGLNK